MRMGGQQRGFTLLELMVALTLVALLAAILYGAFYLGHRATEKMEPQLAKNQTLRSIRDLLGGYIRSAYPYRTTPQQPFVLFSGERDQLTFVSTLSMGMGGRGLSKISFYWKQSVDEGSIFVLEEELPVWGTGQRRAFVLWTGVEELNFEYLDSRSREESWVSSWDGERQTILPRAVRVGLKDQGGEEGKWMFPIIVSPLPSS